MSLLWEPESCITIVTGFRMWSDFIPYHISEPIINPHCGFDDKGLNPFSKCLRCSLPFGTTTMDNRFPGIVTGDPEKDSSE